MQLALGALAVYNLRPSDHTPVEEVNILWALEGGSSPTTGSPSGPSKGFLVFRSAAYQGEDDGGSLP